MKTLLASIPCRFTSPSGTSRDIVVGISAPHPHDRYEFGCFVTVPDRDEPFEIFGVDSLQALSLAMRFASSRIDDLISKGCHFYSSDNDEEYEIDWSAYFMPQSVIDKLEAIGEQHSDLLANQPNKKKHNKSEMATPRKPSD